MTYFLTIAVKCLSLNRKHYMIFQKFSSENVSSQNTSVIKSGNLFLAKLFTPLKFILENHLL